MPQAPLGSFIGYWLRPSKDRAHIHRIEVKHALCLAAANQEQIKETLTDMLRRQTASLENTSFSLDELRDTIAAGFIGLAEGLSEVDGTLRRGFYQLHIDNLGTHTRLDDILACLLDKEEFKRELAGRYVHEAAQRARLVASNDYPHSVNMVQRALNESDMDKAGLMLDEAINHVRAGWPPRRIRAPCQFSTWLSRADAPA